MRAYLLTGACLFLFFLYDCSRADFLEDALGSSSRDQLTEKRDPIAILEVGAAQSWNF